MWCIEQVYIVQLHDFKNIVCTLELPFPYKLSYCWHPRDFIRYTLSTTHLSTTSRVSRSRRSLLHGMRKGLPYSPIADFSDITSSRNIFCTSGPLHNARSTHRSNSIMTRVISGPLNIHFCRIAGDSVRPTAPPSSFTQHYVGHMVYRLPGLKTHDSSYCL